MQSIRVFVVFFFSSLVFFNAFGDEASRIKNGRHYIRYLSAALEVPSYEIEPLYEDLKFNLPKEGNSAEFIVAKDSMAKIADYMCDVVDVMVGDMLDIDYLYERLLGREPTQEERSKAITVDGVFSFYPNCFVLALHPDVVKGN